MDIIKNIQSILTVTVAVTVYLAAIAKAVSVIIKHAKNVQEATEAEREAAKATIIENLQQIIFGLVTEAEKELGSGTGKLKASKVAGQVYDKIPDELKALFSADEIQDMIESSLRSAQEYWNKNVKAREYIESGAATLVAAVTETVSTAPGAAVDEIVQAVGERIGDAIAKATGTAAETPQNGQNNPGDLHPQKDRKAPQTPQNWRRIQKISRHKILCLTISGSPIILAAGRGSKGEQYPDDTRTHKRRRTQRAKLFDPLLFFLLD